MPASLTPYQARLILNALPHIGPVLLKRLLEHFEGDPVALLAANPSELTAVHGVGKMIAATLNQWSSHFNLAREEGLLETTATRFISMALRGLPTTASRDLRSSDRLVLAG
jgi:NAD-dependent DNA ligase